MLKSLSFFYLAVCFLTYAAGGVPALPAQVPPSAAISKTTLTPQAIAFLKAIADNNVSLVTQNLKLNPALANLPVLYYKGNTGRVSGPPLLKAAEDNNVQIMMLLLQAGANVNAEDFFEQTPLDAAAFSGGKEAVELLLAHGADIKHQDHGGETALYRAVEGDNAAAVAALLAHGADVNACDFSGKSPLALALDPPNPGPHHAEVLALLRRHGAKAKMLTPEEAAFLKAIDDNDLAAVKRYLKVNPALADLRPIFDPNDTASLDHMTELPVLTAARSNDVPTMTLLLKAGAHPDVENSFGQTALGLAAFYGNAEIATLLLVHGANIAHRNAGHGQTALYEAIGGDHPDIITLLLAHGANINTRDNEGATPLAIALGYSSRGQDRTAVIKLLRRHGAKE